MEFFNLLFGQGHSSVQAALLVCLFWIALVKPERIRSVGTFRVACLVFAVTFVAPVLTNLFLVGGNPLMPQTRPGMGQNPGAWMYVSAIPPALLMISFLLAIDSITPRRPRGVFEQAVYPEQPR